MKRLNDSTKSAALIRPRGFTLVELLIATSISVIVCGMATYFLFEGLRASLKTSAIYTNDMTQWGLTNRLLIDTKLANCIEIFQDNSTTTLTNAAILIGGSPAGGVDPGSFGNFIVLALGAETAGTSTMAYSSLYGYYYSPSLAKEDGVNTFAAQTLYRFQYTVPSSDTTLGLEAIVAKDENNFQYTAVANGLTLPALPAGDSETNGAFLNRSAFLANLLLRAKSGVNLSGSSVNDTLTSNSRMIEVAFYARQ